MMMTIARGGELRQLWLLGIQIQSADRFIIEVCFFSPQHFFFLWMASVRV